MFNRIFANSSYERARIICEAVGSLQKRAEAIMTMSVKTKADTYLLSKITLKRTFLARVIVLESSFARASIAIKQALSGKERFVRGQYYEALISLIDEKLDFVLRKIILVEASSDFISDTLEELDSLLKILRWEEVKNK